MALGVIIKQKHSLEHDNVNFHNATSYAEHNTCPDFLDPGQATLQTNRKSSSDQPNIFEELHTAELAAVCRSHMHARLRKACTVEDHSPDHTLVGIQAKRLSKVPCQHCCAHLQVLQPILIVQSFPVLLLRGPCHVIVDL